MRSLDSCKEKPLAFVMYLERKDGSIERLLFGHYDGEQNKMIKDQRPDQYQYLYEHDPGGFGEGISRKHAEMFAERNGKSKEKKTFRSIPASMMMARMNEDEETAKELEEIRETVRSKEYDLPLTVSPGTLRCLSQFEPGMSEETVCEEFRDYNFVRRYRSIQRGMRQGVPCHIFKTERIYPNIKLTLKIMMKAGGRGGILVPAPDSACGYSRIGLKADRWPWPNEYREKRSCGEF